MRTVRYRRILPLAARPAQGQKNHLDIFLLKFSPSSPIYFYGMKYFLIAICLCAPGFSFGHINPLSLFVDPHFKLLRVKSTPYLSVSTIPLNLQFEATSASFNRANLLDLNQFQANLAQNTQPTPTITHTPVTSTPAFTISSNQTVNELNASADTTSQDTSTNKAFPISESTLAFLEKNKSTDETKVIIPFEPPNQSTLDPVSLTSRALFERR